MTAKKKALKAATTILFKLEGSEKIKPEAFSGKDIATIIINLEESLREIAKLENPEIKEDQLFISLIEIVHASDGLKFKPSLKVIGAAFLTVATAFQTNSFDKLPVKSVYALREVQRVISHKENCVGTFISGRTKISQIKKSTIIEIPDIGNITGETILYGTIQRVGGAEPKIVLKQYNGDLLSLTVTEKVAKSIASKLYDEVGLKGTATWSYLDNKILSFKVDSLSGYEKTSIKTAFDELRGSIGKYWDEVEDIEETLLLSE